MVFPELVQAGSDALVEILGLEFSAVGVSADVEALALLGIVYFGYKYFKNKYFKK